MLQTYAEEKSNHVSKLGYEDLLFSSVQVEYLIYRLIDAMRKREIGSQSLDEDLLFFLSSGGIPEIPSIPPHSRPKTSALRVLSSTP
jgi:hypothetical protein